MEAFTVGMTILALALIYKLMLETIKIVAIAVIIGLALFGIGWGVHGRRKNNHGQTN